jgi:restriction system protein
MAHAWMIRAGRGGYVADDFARGYVAIGWDRVGDLTRATTPAEVRNAYKQAYSDAKPGEIGSAVAMINKFRSTIKIGDQIISYDPSRREYMIGRVMGEYTFNSDVVKDHPHVRRVEWIGRVSRDRLRVRSRNTLGSTLTLFSIPEDVLHDVLEALGGRDERHDAKAIAVDEVQREELEESREDTEARALELIKDRLLRLDPEQMEHLVAALLRAMGYRTRVTPKGPDRGVDVFASPDGLGFQEPRIKVEVKHRRGTTIGSQEIRSFLGGLRPGDRGLYVSTGGYSKEGKYEAERSNFPISLLDLHELASYIVAHYESFDLEGKALIPLVKVYWPAE